MKPMLILIIFSCLVSCVGKVNNTSQSPEVSAYDQKPYLVISHSNENSTLREKLLHLKLNLLTHQQSEVRIVEQDKFQLKAEKNDNSFFEESEYEKMRETSVEIVVNYSDRTEVYFLPTGILRDQVLKNLKLSEEQDRKLDWLKETPTVLSRGETYYLVSFSKNDLISMDQKLFQNLTEVSSEMNKVYQFTPNQRVILYYKIDFLVPEIVYEERERKIRCPKGGGSDGGCDSCLTKIQKRSGNFIRGNWNLQDFELSIVVNGKQVLLKDLMVKQINDETLSVEVNLDQFKSSREVSIQILPPVITQQTQMVSPVFVGGICGGFLGNRSTLDLTPVVKPSYQVQSLGRRLNF